MRNWIHLNNYISNLQAFQQNPSQTLSLGYLTWNTFLMNILLANNKHATSLSFSIRTIEQYLVLTSSVWGWWIHPSIPLFLSPVFISSYAHSHHICSSKEISTLLPFAYRVHIWLTNKQTNKQKKNEEKTSNFSGI